MTVVAAASAAAVLSLGPGTRASSASAPAPQGTLVFASDRTGTFQIYSVRADGTRLGQLTHGNAAATAPLFSPDGRRIVFTRSPKEYVSELWVMNADGTGERRLAASGSAPAWSHDSRHVAYVLRRADGRSSPLAIADVAGGRTVLVRGKNGAPTWSPDDTLIAFSHVVGETYCCDRTNLMVVRPDGRGLRTVRRDAAAIGWSPHGEIAFTGRYGARVGLIGRDGRGARPLLRFRPNVLAWSPDGRRLAFLGDLGLQVASAEGRDVRSLLLEARNVASTISWSPDSRWIAVHVDGLVIVAADGSSTRVVTSRLARPAGTNYGPPSWRPRGATAARLGAPPTAALPTETASSSTFTVGTGGIAELAADGGLAAVVVHDAPRSCARVEAWEPAKRHYVRVGHQGCLDHGVQFDPAHGLAVAGRQVGWLEVDGGNTRESAVEIATPERPGPSTAADAFADGGGYGDNAYEPVGHDRLIAFTVSHRCDEYASGGPPPGDCTPGHQTGDIVHAAITLCRDGRSCRVAATADGELRALAVDAKWIAARTDDGVRVLTVGGKTVADLTVKADRAALSGRRLALRTAGAIVVYDAPTGKLTRRLRVPGAATLEDLEGDIVVTATENTVTLRRLGGGHSLTLHTSGPAHAQLEPAGLFLAGIDTVTFTPMREVLRRLR